jgi:hypothetical protein
MTKNSAAIEETEHSTNAHSKEITGFVPTQDELIHLVKHWVRKAIDDEYFIFWGQCYGSSYLRCIDFDWERISEIAQILGEEETNKAVRKGYEEAAQDFERSDWIVFRYGTKEERTAYQDKGGQCLSDFECGVAEEIACKVVQRVFRDGTPEQQQAFIKDELARYARKLRNYKRASQHVVEIFGIHFPDELRSLVLTTGADDPNPQPNGFFGTLSIAQRMFPYPRSAWSATNRSPGTRFFTLTLLYPASRNWRMSSSSAGKRPAPRVVAPQRFSASAPTPPP